MYKKSYLLIFLIILLSVFLVLASEVLLPFIIGIIIAYILNPLVVKMEKAGINHLLSVLMVLLLAFVFCFGSFLFLIPILIDQLEIILKKLPYVFDKLKFYLIEYVSNIGFIEKEEYSKYISNFISNKSGDLIKYLFEFLAISLDKSIAIINIIGLVFITPIVVFFTLNDWNKILNYLNKNVSKNIISQINPKIIKINKVLSSFFRGQLIVAFLLVIYYSITLTLLEIEGSFSIGMLIGILSILPYLGFIVGILISISFALIQFGTINIVIYVLLVFILGQFLESYVLSPRYISKNIGLHPLLSMFVIIASGAAFGLIGILLAIPLTAVLCSIIFDSKK